MKEYDTKSLIYTVLLLVIIMCIITLWIVFGSASREDLPSWLNWILN